MSLYAYVIVGIPVAAHVDIILRQVVNVAKLGP